MNKDELLTEIKKRFKEAYDAHDNLYSDCLDDLRFLRGGAQWPSDLKADRLADGRPCLEINKLPNYCDQVIGDVRQNEPSIKVKGVDSQSDPEVAEILTGLIRNIEVQNDAEIIYDTAVEMSIQCGIGAFRIGTKYADDDTFDQDITMTRIKNPFTIYWDPAAQNWDKSDAKYCFVTTKISRDEFKKLYPNASYMPFEGGRDRDPMWGDDKTIRIVEYFKKEPAQKKLYLVQHPMGATQVIDRPPDNPEWQITKERSVDTHKIVWYKANQHEILEGPTDWPGKYIPICMCYGKELNIEGETDYRGVTRHAKDAQRLYNYSRSTGGELVSLAPKSPYLVTAKMIANYQAIWDKAHKRNFPYLPYDVDKENPQALPKRAEPIAMNTAIGAEIQISDQEMHDTTGLQQASLGQKSNEKSGRAIMVRQREGDVANFAYYDNLGRAIRYAGKVLLDLIPKIYDTARIVRIINREGQDKSVPVNQSFMAGTDQQGNPIEKIFDLTVGKYDAAVSIGPSYTTQREEAAENIMNFIKVVPAAGPLLGDLLAKNMDWPQAQEIEKRLKLLLPPQLQQAEGQGGQPPPPSPPPPPDPLQMMEIRGRAAEIQGAELDNETKFENLRRTKAGETEGKESASKK